MAAVNKGGYVLERRGVRQAPSSGVNRLKLLAVTQALTFAFRALSAAGAFALVTGPFSAFSSEEHPPQKEWVITEHADVVSGDLYPAAILMSRDVTDAALKAKGIGNAYIAVGNYSKRPMEVEFSWDEPLSKPSTVNCKVGGCEVEVRFGTNTPTKFLAIRHKHAPTLILQDGRALIAAATRYTGPIEVRVQTLRDGLIIHRFTAAKRLDLKKLGALKP